MRTNYFEMAVGAVTIVFSLAFVLFSMRLTDRRIGQRSYRLYARFSSANGIGPGARVKIGGVDVGHVRSLLLEDDYTVLVSLDMRSETRIPVDSCLRISTNGLLGGKYLKIDVGGEDDIIQPEGTFDFTESSMDLEDMITRFLLGGVSSGK
ncbi:MAG: MlaD family protein [Rickettsiales bacterium]|jgi:phospholipid/cholesterol/gamma-HCH transport system substrate-binding protein|nr:MlaD family protein [Rickettsiales bacterium]